MDVYITMSGNLLYTMCDMCYPRPAEAAWAGVFTHIDGATGAQFTICNNCKLFIIDVVGVALHVLTHAQILDAIKAKLKECNITEEDLFRKPQPISTSPKAIGHTHECNAELGDRKCWCEQ